MKTLKEDQVHVYFYTLPNGTKFIHKGEEWVKIEEEKAKDSDGKQWRFEVHYGCFIPRELAEEINLKKEDHRPL